MNVLEVKPQYIGTMAPPLGVNIISPIMYSALLNYSLITSRLLKTNYI